MQTAGLTTGPTCQVPTTVMVERRQPRTCHVSGLAAVGRLRSGDIRVAAVTEEDRDQLVAAADRWLPKLSDLLSLARRTYPVLVLGVPSTFNMSINGEDMRGIIDSNNEFIEHPSAIQHVEFLPHRRTQAASRENHALIICFADPTTANCCIDHHVILWGRLLPTVKYVHHPPQCYSCHQEGHLAHSCRQKPHCGLCAGEHNTRDCRGTWTEGSPCRFIPLKFPSCDRPHTVKDIHCPVRREVIHNHWCKIADTGPHFPV